MSRGGETPPPEAVKHAIAHERRNLLGLWLKPDLQQDEMTLDDTALLISHDFILVDQRLEAPVRRVLNPIITIDLTKPIEGWNEQMQHDALNP